MFLLLVIIALIILVVWRSKTKESYSRIVDLFNNTTTNLDDIGGLLVNNFGHEWFEKMLQAGDVTLQDSYVCASINQKTCTAYSYIRRDLVPMFFMFPGIKLYVPCGIILDPKKIWPLITLMAVVDADTNNRNACINESGGPILVYNPAGNSSYDQRARANLVQQFGAQSPYLDYAVFIPSKERFKEQDVQCCDDRCKYIHSGGSINQWLMNASEDKAFDGCYQFQEVPYKDVPAEIRAQAPGARGFLTQTTSCAACTKPYLCVFDNYGPDKYATVFEPDRIANYIGPDGQGFVDLFNQGPNIDIGAVAISQCRFEKKDWNRWIRVLKEWYKTLIARADNSLYANPFRPSYFENEVNLYINPNKYSREAYLQNKLFQDAIIGFYYTDALCEDQMAPLEGIETRVGDAVFSGSVDRCDKFWQLDDPSMTTAKRRQWEQEKRAETRALVHRVADMFNAKHGRNVPVYRSRADSNSFPNKDSIEAALKGNIQLEDFLILDS